MEKTQNGKIVSSSFQISKFFSQKKKKKKKKINKYSRGNFYRNINIKK
jgi:hypothetical protein